LEKKGAEVSTQMKGREKERILITIFLICGKEGKRTLTGHGGERKHGREFILKKWGEINRLTD